MRACLGGQRPLACGGGVCRRVPWSRLGWPGPRGSVGGAPRVGSRPPALCSLLAPPAHARPPRPNCCWSNHVGGAGSGATRGNSNVQKDGGRAVGRHPPEAPRPGRTAVARRMGRPLPEAPGQPSGASRPPAVAPGLPAARRPARRSPCASVPGPGSWCACELLTEGGLACDLRPLYRAVTPRRRHSMATCRAAGPGSTSKWTRCCGCGRAPRTSTGEQDRRPCGAPASPATLGQGSDPGSAPVMVWEGHVGR